MAIEDVADLLARWHEAGGMFGRSRVLTEGVRLVAGLDAEERRVLARELAAEGAPRLAARLEDGGEGTMAADRVWGFAEGLLSLEPAQVEHLATNLRDPGRRDRLARQLLGEVPGEDPGAVPPPWRRTPTIRPPANRPPTDRPPTDGPPAADPPPSPWPSRSPAIDDGTPPGPPRQRPREQELGDQELGDQELGNQELGESGVVEATLVEVDVHEISLGAASTTGDGDGPRSRHEPEADRSEVEPASQPTSDPDPGDQEPGDQVSGEQPEGERTDGEHGPGEHAPEQQPRREHTPRERGGVGRPVRRHESGRPPAEPGDPADAADAAAPTASLVAQLRAAPTAGARLRLLAPDILERLPSEQALAVLDTLPEGWQRRRAAGRLIAADGLPTGDIDALLARFPRATDAMFVAGALVAAGQLDAERFTGLLSDAAVRRLACRGDR